MKRMLAATLPLTALFSALPATAQQTPAGPPAERIKQVIVYGDDPCPVSEGNEIVVCARQEESERFRIPETLRGTEPDSPQNEAWTNRVKSIEYIGASGTESCSPVGGGGFTGCFEKMARQAKAERARMGDKSWADLVAAERAKRLSTIDADSEEIEAQVKAEEKARAEAKAAETASEVDHNATAPVEE
ncbi:MAG: hypothetical protein R3E04_06460 [Sphingobium sp.]